MPKRRLWKDKVWGERASPGFRVDGSGPSPFLVYRSCVRRSQDQQGIWPLLRKHRKIRLSGRGLQMSVPACWWTVQEVCVIVVFMCYLSFLRTPHAAPRVRTSRGGQGCSRPPPMLAPIVWSSSLFSHQLHSSIGHQIPRYHQVCSFRRLVLSFINTHCRERSLTFQCVSKIKRDVK